ncbi:MAG: hypothetical protein K6F56_04090 [Oscillospiraceae bacterium]|nr:hypothetical protein [Oscillospiraceae bacterium]
MKTVFLKLIPFLLLLALALPACAQSAPAPTAKPWPTHAPEATPYIRVHVPEPAPTSEEGEPAAFSWDDLYERFGCFYAKPDELEMFRGLKQDEPYSFVPHSARFVLDEGEALRMARLFQTQERVEARVVAMHQITNGLDDWNFLTVISCTPARLFELSETMDETFMIEQLYPTVQERFDIDYWPVGLYKKTDELLQGLEVRGCLYFLPETLEALNDVPRGEVLNFALKEFTPSGWSEDGQELLWILRGRDLEGLALYWRAGSPIGGSLCTASMTVSQLSVLSATLPGRYLVSLLDEATSEAYDGVVRFTADGEEVASA